MAEGIYLASPLASQDTLKDYLKQRELLPRPSVFHIVSIIGPHYKIPTSYRSLVRGSREWIGLLAYQGSVSRRPLRRAFKYSKSRELRFSF